MNQLSGQENRISPEGLNQIPELDRQELRQFFEWLLIEGFGYTLFGNKPMSSKTFYECEEYSNVVKGADVFEKYSAQLLAGNFALRCVSSEDSISIYCVNKRECKRAIIDNPTFFELGEDVERSASRIVDTIVSSEPIEDAWQDSRINLGVLYGYGFTNAYLYDRMLILRRAERGTFYVEPAEDFASISEELTFLEGQLKNFCKGEWMVLGAQSEPELGVYKRPSLIVAPQFIALPTSNESKEIIAHYNELTPRLQSIRDGNILEEVWRQFQEN